ncbi:MAG TPA: hypothetical protein VI365_15480 [Trebonia sp.]
MARDQGGALAAASSLQAARALLGGEQVTFGASSPPDGCHVDAVIIVSAW